MSNPQLSILIPAAGASKRLGQSKQLVQYKSTSLIQNAVNIASSIGPGEVIERTTNIRLADAEAINSYNIEVIRAAIR